MSNTLKAITFLASVLILATILTVSCISLNHNLRYTTAPRRTSAPVDAFVLVDVTQETSPGVCTSNNSNIDCDNLIKTLPHLRSGSSGSGLLVLSSEGPVILTAGHVCEADTPDVFRFEDVEITVVVTVTIKVHSPTKGTYSATVIKIDSDKDLCMLKPEEVFTHAVPIADSEPEIGGKVYTIAAPFGISGDNLALVFHGFFSGTKGQRRYYTVPTRPGSSGAAVLNDRWEVIGVLHTAFRNLENVGIGTGLEDIKTFLFSSSDD
jgi:S1-C subfamily serine protease